MSAYDIVYRRLVFCGRSQGGLRMKRVFGLALFSAGAGMTFILIFPKSFFCVCISAVCLIVGYNLFCS